MKNEKQFDAVCPWLYSDWVGGCCIMYSRVGGWVLYIVFSRWFFLAEVNSWLLAPVFCNFAAGYNYSSCVWFTGSVCSVILWSLFGRMWSCIQALIILCWQTLWWLCGDVLSLFESSDYNVEVGSQSVEVCGHVLEHIDRNMELCSRRVLGYCRVMMKSVIIVRSVVIVWRSYY